MKLGMNMRLYQQNDQSGSVAGINVLPSISLSSSLNPPGSGFNLPSIANGSAAGISSTDSTRLLSTVNDLLGIPATLKQGFLGNLNSNTFSPLHSGDFSRSGMSANDPSSSTSSPRTSGTYAGI
jgi:hypothetical protein